MKKTMTGFLFAAVAMHAQTFDRVTAGSPSHDFVIVNYDGQHVPNDLEAMLRFNTTVRLPKGELATEASAGDAADMSKPGSGDWIIQLSPIGDAVYIKPTKQGVKTNIEVRTDHGNRYTFFISDRSLDTGAHLHLEYIVNPTGQAEVDAIKAPAKWVPAEKLTETQAEVAKYKKDRDEIEAKWQAKFSQSQITARQDTLNGLSCADYLIGEEAHKWKVSQACHDHDWLYVWAKEAPTQYAFADMSMGTAHDLTPDFDPASGMYTFHVIPERLRISIGNGKKTKSVELVKKGGA